MEIRPFLELCAGTWFSQRTRYAFADQAAENHKSELTIAFLEPSHELLLKLCEQDIKLCLGGWQVSWNSMGDWGSSKQTGAAVVAFVAEAGQRSGQLWRSPSRAGQSFLQGHFNLDNDGALTLYLGDGNLEAEERIWFASDNLRLRTSVFKQGDRYCQTAFYSEIRKVQVPPQEN
jgi:phycoerythrin-associated linker protein